MNATVKRVFGRDVPAKSPPASPPMAPAAAALALRGTATVLSPGLDAARVAQAQPTVAASPATAVAALPRVSRGTGCESVTKQIRCSSAYFCLAQRGMPRCMLLPYCLSMYSLRLRMSLTVRYRASSRPLSLQRVLIATAPCGLEVCRHCLWRRSFPPSARLNPSRPLLHTAAVTAAGSSHFLDQLLDPHPARVHR
jgi:hypothetical protein